MLELFFLLGYWRSNSSFIWVAVWVVEESNSSLMLIALVARCVLYGTCVNVSTAFKTSVLNQLKAVFIIFSLQCTWIWSDLIYGAGGTSFNPVQGKYALVTHANVNWPRWIRVWNVKFTYCYVSVNVYEMGKHSNFAFHLFEAGPSETSKVGRIFQNNYNKINYSVN